MFFYYIGVRLNRKRGRDYFTRPRSVWIRYIPEKRYYNNPHAFLQERYLIWNLDDFRNLEEMFVAKQYRLPDVFACVIVDLGSNIGNSIRYFMYEYPGADIYGFEPVKESYDRMYARVGDYPNVTVEQKAIDTTSGKTVPIYIHPKGLSGSSNFQMRGGTVQEAETISLDDIMEKYNLPFVDILKVDIEGLEYEVFKSFKNLSRVNYILVELHPPMSAHSKEEFLALVSDFEVLEEAKNGKMIELKLRRKVPVERHETPRWRLIKESPAFDAGQGVSRGRGDTARSN